MRRSTVASSWVPATRYRRVWQEVRRVSRARSHSLFARHDIREFLAFQDANAAPENLLDACFGCGHGITAGTRFWFHAAGER